jgi:hypothetical protein
MVVKYSIDCNANCIGLVKQIWGCRMAKPHGSAAIVRADFQPRRRLRSIELPQMQAKICRSHATPALT